MSMTLSGLKVITSRSLGLKTRRTGLIILESSRVHQPPELANSAAAAVRIERQAGRRRLPACVVSFLANSSRPAAHRVESRGEGSWKEFPTGPGQGPRVGASRCTPFALERSHRRGFGNLAFRLGLKSTQRCPRECTSASVTPRPQCLPSARAPRRAGISSLTDRGAARVESPSSLDIWLLSRTRFWRWIAGFRRKRQSH